MRTPPGPINTRPSESYYVPFLRRSFSFDYREPGGGPPAQLALNLFVDLTRRELGRDADGVLDRIRVRTAVRNNADSPDAEQRRSAVFRIIQALLEFFESLPGEHIPDLAGDGGCEGIAQHVVEHVHQRSEERRVGKECRSRWSPDH